MCIVACSLDGNLNTQNLFNWVGNTDGTKDAFAKEMASNPAVAKFKSDFWDGMFPQLDTDLAPAATFLSTQDANQMEKLQNTLKAHFPIFAFQSGATTAILTMDYTEETPSFAVHKFNDNGDLDVSMLKIYSLNGAIHILKDLKRVAETA